MQTRGARILTGHLLPLPRPTGPDHQGPAPAPEDLMSACARGDRDALGALFDRFHVPVYRFLSRVLGPAPADLDDLVQATFLEVMRSAASFHGDSAVQTWIFGIAANLARRAVRGEQRRRRLLFNLSERLSRTPSGPRPDDGAETSQLLGRLAVAVAELPEGLRTAFVLCDLEQVPGVEVARVLGLREGTLWRRLHDARKRLRRALQPES